MALVYFDSSALVKLVVEEDGTETAAALWDGCDAALSSRIAYPEVCAALAAGERDNDLDSRGHASALRAWESFWASTRPVELTVDVESAAGDLARRYALRGADAIHLASARVLGDPDLVVAVWDRRLHEGAVALGLTVAPAMLES